eukprot:COSAG01_NODE_3319_length_6269_cov_5.161264_3_plen_347_part_00
MPAAAQEILRPYVAATMRLPERAWLARPDSARSRGVCTARGRNGGGCTGRGRNGRRRGGRVRAQALCGGAARCSTSGGGCTPRRASGSALSATPSARSSSGASSCACYSPDESCGEASLPAAALGCWLACVACHVHSHGRQWGGWCGASRRRQDQREAERAQQRGTGGAQRELSTRRAGRASAVSPSSTVSTAEGAEHMGVGGGAGGGGQGRGARGGEGAGGRAGGWEGDDVGTDGTLPRGSASSPRFIQRLSPRAGRRWQTSRARGRGRQRRWHWRRHLGDGRCRSIWSRAQCERQLDVGHLMYSSVWSHLHTSTGPTPAPVWKRVGSGSGGDPAVPASCFWGSE